MLQTSAIDKAWRLKKLLGTLKIIILDSAMGCRRDYQTGEMPRSTEWARVGIKGNEKGSSQELKNGLEKQENRER